jgi:hypothetical protein
MMKNSGRTISDADKAKMDKIMSKSSGRTISDADKARMKTIMGYKKGGKVMAQKMASKKGMKK